MILFYGRMIAPEKRHLAKKVYISTSNPYNHWLKKLYRIYNEGKKNEQSN